MPCYAGGVRNIQDNHLISYNVLDADGNHIGSETIALSIQKVSNGYWFDFSDSTFKESGWTNKTTNLTEDSTNGFYYYSFNPPASETTANEYLMVIDNASATNGDHQAELVCYQNIGTGTSTLVTGDLATATVGTVTTLTNGVTVTTNNDKAGYTISGTKTTLDAMNDITAASVWGVTTRVLTALDEDTTTIDLNASTVGGLTTWDKTGYALSAAGVDAVWDEVQSGHTTPGTFGYYLDVQCSLIPAGGTVAAGVIADAMWDALIADHKTSGTMGERLYLIPTPYNVRP
jgi:hypothetical protein